MKKEEAALKEALENCTPDVLNHILEGCRNKEQEKAEPQTSPVAAAPAKKKPAMLALLPVAAAVVILMVAGLFGLREYRIGKAPDSVISFDVNPSIELTINAKEQVIAASALNEDAKKIIGDMKLEGADLSVAVNALIGSMVRNGYISEIANSILITVDNKDSAKGEELENRLMASINEILKENEVEGAVLAQVATKTDATLEELAKQYQISTGRCALINTILEQEAEKQPNSTLTFETLAGMTVNELYLLADSRETRLQGITASGTASADSYIGEAAAVEAALERAGINAEDVIAMRCEFDYENGEMVYEINLVTRANVFEAEIAAKTGTILEFEKEHVSEWAEDYAGKLEDTIEKYAEKWAAWAEENLENTLPKITGIPELAESLEKLPGVADLPDFDWDDKDDDYDDRDDQDDKDDYDDWKDDQDDEDDYDDWKDDVKDSDQNNAKYRDWDNYAEAWEDWAEQNGRQWEEWAKKYSKDWEAWAKEYGDDWEDWALEHQDDWQAWKQEHAEEWESWVQSAEPEKLEDILKGTIDTGLGLLEDILDRIEDRYDYDDADDRDDDNDAGDRDDADDRDDDKDDDDHDND